MGIPILVKWCLYIESGHREDCCNISKCHLICIDSLGQQLAHWNWSNPEGYGWNQSLPNQNRNTTKSKPCTSFVGSSDGIQETLQWRHNERDGISNHWPHDCLLNRLFRRISKKTSKLCVTGLCEGNSLVTGIGWLICTEGCVSSLNKSNPTNNQWLVNSPHKGPVTWKIFPFDDAIMKKIDSDASNAIHSMTFYFVWNIDESMGNESVRLMSNLVWFGLCCMGYSIAIFMMMSSDGNIFRVTGLLCGEFSGHWWIPRTRPVTRSFDVFFDLCLE